MGRLIFYALILFQSVQSFAQTPAELGFQYLQTFYKDDTVNILIKSKKGEEHIKKPLFLFCQGSLPIPLMITYEEKTGKSIYSVFPFNADNLCDRYHLAIIGKPFIPVVVNQQSLAPDLTFKDSSGKFPKEYINRNLLTYYVARNIHAIKYLQKQIFIDKKALVLAGHSEGSAIAANIAYQYKKVTHLIYSGGSPLGRIMTIVQRERQEQIKDSSTNTNNLFDDWMKLSNSNGVLASNDSEEKTLYQFSNPPTIEILLKLSIPVLVTYGTRDYGAVAQNDYLRISSISMRKQNISFKEYKGLDHNFFPLLDDGKLDFEKFNWDIVAEDWRKWLQNNP